MTPEKGRHIIAHYRFLLHHLPKGEGPFDRTPTPREAMSHLHGMLDKMEEFLNAVDRSAGVVDPDDDKAWFELCQDLESWDKFNRWLGFMQGAFWLHGDFTLNGMRDHNRTQKEVTHGDFGSLIREEKTR